MNLDAYVTIKLKIENCLDKETFLKEGYIKSRDIVRDIIFENGLASVAECSVWIKHDIKEITFEATKKF